MVTLLYPAMVLPYLLRALRLRLVFNWATKRSLLRGGLARTCSRRRVVLTLRNARRSTS
jgi:hypothetical protein